MITLNSKRLTLIPFTLTDQEEVRQVLTDPYVRKYLWDDEIIDLGVIEELLAGNEARFKKDKWGIWKVIRNHDNMFMGFAGLWIFFNQIKPQLVAGLFETFTGQGYASEASQRIIEYAFSHLKYKSISAAMDAPNAESIKLAKNLGMKFKESKIIDNAATLFYELERG